MRIINSIFVFVFCLLMVLFSVENTQIVTIQIVEGVQFEAPLAIELFIAMGLGAFLAWLFGIWMRLLQWLPAQKNVRQIRKQEARIQELEQNIEQFQAELQHQHQLPPSAEPLTSQAYLADKVSAS